MYTYKPTNAYVADKLNKFFLPLSQSTVKDISTNNAKIGTHVLTQNLVKQVCACNFVGAYILG